MADFQSAFEAMIRNEGGYINHCIAGDRGGQTYAGIARCFHPDWGGWSLLDHNKDNPKLTALVREFYNSHFWTRIKGDYINHQAIATSLFDFSVNAGVKTAVKLAQLVVEATPDGILGAKTLGKLNGIGEEVFIAKYALAKVARYREIVQKDREQEKFLLGWINRTLGSIG